MSKKKYKQKKKRKHKSQNSAKITPHSNESTARFWACFWRDGYWFLVGIIILLIGCKDIYYIGFSIAAIIYGIYWFYMTIKLPRHFILAMLKYDRESMKNARRNYHPVRIKEWQHRAKVTSLFSIIGGAVLLIISIIML